MTSRPKGAVAAGHQSTAEAGAEMLRAGGSAIDAAIAALAMVCVCEPVLASPGGGGFAMIRDGNSGKIRLIDFFTQTPRVKREDTQDGFRTIEADFGNATQVFHIGPATVATPGFLDGLTALSKNGARLSGVDHFAPAIAAASDGVETTKYQAYLSSVVAPILTATPAARDLFAPEGALLEAGDLFRNPALAETFKRLSQMDWRQAGIAAALLKEQAEGGHITSADLENYSVQERDPLSVPLSGATVHVNPLPAASGTLIQYALRHMEGFSSIGVAKALEEADRARIMARGGLTALLKHPLRQNGTTHVSAVDAEGNACAVTVSNGTGNGEIVEGFGFMLNNILGEEDVNPGGATGWPINVRPASMMCPTILEMPDGRLIALGSGGSSRIRSAVFQAVARLALDEVDIQDAVEAPRIHVENGHLDVESLLSPAELNELTEAFSDHRLWPEKNMFFGGVHAVQLAADGSFDAVGDGRRDGVSVVVA